MNIRKGNKQFIKDINRAHVLNEIRLNGPISRTDISKNLKLGLSTISNIIDELIQSGMVFEVGEADSTGGRKPILLEFNYNYGYVIGIKIEENALKFAVTNLKTTIIHRRKIKFYKKSTPEKVIDIIVKNIKDIIADELNNKSLLGIGIAVSGLVDQKHGKLIYSSILDWNNVEIKSLLQKEFSVPVFIDNDVNVYTLAELWHGYGQSLNNFIVVTYGAGVGSGIVINKRIYRGEMGGAGEIGHTIIMANGRKCECGQSGCLEAYASENFVIEFIKEKKEEYLDNIIDISEELSIEKIYEFYKNGSQIAYEAIAKSAEYLAIGIVSVVNFLNPSAIILAGEGMVAQDIVLPIVNRIVKQNYFRNHNKKLQILISNLNEEAFEVGASILVISNLFDLPIYEEQNETFISML